MFRAFPQNVGFAVKYPRARAHTRGFVGEVNKRPARTRMPPAHLTMNSESTLDTRLAGALHLREKRAIRRRLPEPTTLSSKSSPIDFSSNDYLSLATSPALRAAFLAKLHAAPDILGSGGSRLLVNNHAHTALEARLAHFFAAPAGLLFNSGFDANVGFFSCVPGPGDVVLCDEYIHASVHDGLRASRVAPSAQLLFAHNFVSALHDRVVQLLHDRPGLKTGEQSLFVAVESLYSMDGTFAPLAEIVQILEECFPAHNAYLIVDEAHATGIYGPQGRGRVAELGLEDKVLARLHTFGKALAATGAVILTTPLIRDYLVNYARPLIYTTALSPANILAADASVDMLLDGTAAQLSSAVLDLSSYLVASLRPRLLRDTIPPALLSLPAHLPSAPASPIIPIMSSHPRALSAHLLNLGMNARPISWPTVPVGKDRVRVCLHAGNSRADVDRLVEGVLEWGEKNGHLADEKQPFAVQSRL